MSSSKSFCRALIISPQEIPELLLRMFRAGTADEGDNSDSDGDDGGSVCRSSALDWELIN